MSSDSEPSTLPLEDNISDLAEDGEALESASTVPVNLVSLVPAYKSIPLTKSKTIVGRNSIERKDGTLDLGGTISRTHCEISSRSISEDAEAAIWIKDTSSNGIWVNDKRIAKDEPTKIFNKDIISFAPGSVKATAETPTFMLVDERVKKTSSEQRPETSKRPNEAVEEDTSAKESEPEAKKAKVDEESVFEKEFNCGICHDIMHKALVLQPCLHSFCKDCCKTWLQTSNDCPSCRRQVTKTKRDFRLNNLISAFLENRPHLQRDDIEDDGVESDGSDLIASRARNRNRNRNRTRNPFNGMNADVDDDDDDDDEDEDEDSDDDDGIGAQPIPLPVGFVGLPAVCPCCDPNNTLGYVCPDAVRLNPLPPGATYTDYLVSRHYQPGHTQCRHCRTHLPIIPPTVQGIAADQFQCKMCHTPTCGCRARSLDDMIATQYPFTGFVNHAEEAIINDYITANNLTRASVWQDIKTGMDNGTYSYLGTQHNPRAQGQDVTSAHKLCDDCGQKFYMNGPLYQWRIGLDPATLPTTVTSKENCWYGRECRTQFNNAHRPHAERLNHMCENRPRQS
ncbi:MAG: hypothetical protein J3Q66DRAFT_440528 [Benniella sp.]|nr:MAG: hypothetical protein J3Q66DRAFT_440528 [Benniella sp.]